MLYQLIPGFLGASMSKDLFHYALANEARFEQTGVGTGNEVQGEVRRSRKLVDLGEFSAPFQERANAIIPDAIAALRLSPFEHTGYEMEMVAHEEGAFYRRHIDLFTDTHRENVNSDRMLSLVYYFHREPRAFTGGELRLHPAPVPAGSAQFVDVVPQHDTAVVFSSWVPHEVRPIACPSGSFGDARFAVNCWVLRDKVAK